MQAIRHGTMLPSLHRNEIGTSELDPFIAVEMAIADDPPNFRSIAPIRVKPTANGAADAGYRQRRPNRLV